MVHFLGEFPVGFKDKVDSERDDVLVVSYPAKVDKDSLPEGITTLIAVSHGFDNVDRSLLQEHGIEFHRIPTGARDVAEFCISTAIHVLRSIPLSSVDSWTQKTGSRLQGKTWGVLGLGVIGKEVAGLAEALGCKILAHDPYVEDSRCVPLKKLFEADVVSIHVPLNEETRGMVGKKLLADFEGVLVDVSRGGVVDLEALQDSKINGAALDVFPKEPYPDDLPEGNILTTPHMASMTEERWSEAVNEVNRITAST